MKHILREELNEFREHWNTHSMRRNKITGFIGGIPNDIYLLPEEYGMYVSILNHIQCTILLGGEQCLLEVEERLWIYAMSNESTEEGEFFNGEFEEVTSGILHKSKNLDRHDITVENFKEIYTHLLQFF